MTAEEQAAKAAEEEAAAAAAEGKDDDEIAAEKAAAEEAKQTKKFAAEAASWRVKLREEQKERAALQSQLDEIKEKMAHVDSESAAGQDMKAQVASLTRQVKTLEQSLTTEKQKREEATNRANQKTIEATVSSLIAQADVIPEVRAQAAKLLRTEVRLSADEKVVVGDDEELTADKVKEILGPLFFPARGVGGTGSRGVKGAATGTSKTDSELIERGMRDQTFYNENRDKIIAAQRRMESTRA
jgi:chromosome segregation ATPase